MMADEIDRPSRARVAGRFAWRLLVPLSAMRSSIHLARKSFAQTRDNLSILKDLSRQARDTLKQGSQSRAHEHDDTFEEAMRRRSRTSMTELELQASFLRKKRMALGVGCLFLIAGIYAVIGGIHYSNLRGVVMGLVSLMASQPVFFIIALDAQFRLWQLRRRRLSREEQGGLQHFMREGGWVWATLDPELTRGKCP